MTQKYLDNVLNKQDGLSELEVKFGTKGIKQITKDDFDNVIKKLISSGFKIIKSQEYCLKIQSEFTDITNGKRKLSYIRAEIYGLSSIQAYCRTDKIDAVNYRFIKKTKAKEGSEIIPPVDFDDFNFRLSYQKESLIPQTSDVAQAIISTWENDKKIFRHINRTTLVHDDYPFHVDLSVVKESHRKDGHPILEYSFKSAKVSECEPKYEIEIEVDNSKVGAGTRFRSGIVLADYLRTGIKLVLAGIQGTNFPVSYEELFKIKQQYYYLLHPEEKMKRLAAAKSSGSKSRQADIEEIIESGVTINLTPNHFIGPSSYTLQILNIAPINEDCTTPNIRNHYSVTDKADGMRKMLYVSPNGRIYLINTNMDFEFTGAVSREEKIYNTLVDGEHILHNKRGDYINLFAAFDIYFLNGSDVRHNAFINLAVEEQDVARLREEIEEEPEEAEERRRMRATASRYEQERKTELEAGESLRGVRKGNQESRLELLKQTLRYMSAQSVISGEVVPIRITSKRFEVATPEKDIFACSSLIMRGQKSGIFEYNIDGLIYTPVHTGVGSNKVGVAGPLHKVTWDMSFKWKPLNQNTIDFLITTKKDKSLKEFVGNIFESGIDTLKSEQLQQYKTIILRVGYDERKHGYINPCAAIIEDNIPRAGDVDLEDGYKPVPFYPTNPYDPEACICNIPLREDENGVLQMFTKNEEIFDDETIVEFSYDATKPKHWRWIAERVRYDKTAEYKRGIKNYGNAYHVANNNWYSIHNPISEEMITTGQNIPDELADDDVYYNRGSGDNMTRSMRDFHNLYVKKMLITKTAAKGNTLIDYAVGKAGDFPKWIDAHLSFVFGIDLSKDNIENRVDGACARFLNYRKKFRSMPYALFVNGDSSANIKSGDAVFTEKGKQIVHALFNEGPKDEGVLGKGVYRQYGKASDGFNISSCQFALHYFFENIEKLNNFIKNLSQCTKVDGYFIGACYDGLTMFNALRSTPRGNSIVLNIDGTKIWEVTKDYSQTTFDDDISSVGYAINVYQDSINKTIKEYLVNFTYFIQLMDSYGFQLIKREDANKMGLPNGSGMFGELYARMEADIQQDQSLRNRYGSAPYMNAKEKQISFYNRYFVFKKISSVDVEDVYRSVTGVHVFEEKMNRKDTKAAQMTALKFAQSMGEGQGEGASSLKYRPSGAAQLRSLESESESLPEASNTVVSQLFGSVAPPAPSSKKKSVKGANLFSMGAVSGTSSLGKSSLSSSSSSPLVVKKSAVLQPVAAESSSMSSPSLQSILERSKAGTKASASKLGKMSAQDAMFAKLSLPEETSSSVILKGKSKAKKGDDGK
jgi:hypothetical protein